MAEITTRNSASGEEKEIEEHEFLFFTLGMFILDDIHHSNKSIPSQLNVVGGGGTFGTLGSRIVSSQSRWKDIKMIIDMGSDFPLEVKNGLDSLKVGFEWRKVEDRLTTRGWNYYHDDESNDDERETKKETRDFEYLAPKKQIDVSELNYFKTKALHLLCSMDRAQGAVDLLKERKVDDDTVVIFEPVPYECVPENLEALINVMKDIDILSPNAKEAADFFGMEEPTQKKELEELAGKFLIYLGKENKGAIVLRCGALGSYTLVRKADENERCGKWYPPYHRNPANVIDPTGCGNTFVGSFVTGFVLSGGDYEVASVCGSVGSGVCIESIGMPLLRDDHYWNGVNVRERIEKYSRENGIKKDVCGILDL